MTKWSFPISTARSPSMFCLHFLLIFIYMIGFDLFLCFSLFHFIFFFFSPHSFIHYFFRVVAFFLSFFFLLSCHRFCLPLRSDVFGHILPNVFGEDWTQSGVAQFYTN